MKVVILAGGRGTRLGDTTKKIPKPMIKLFRIPLLVHIINIYKRQGFKEFVILTGYKSKYISEYFQKSYFKKDISVKCVFTGINTLTGSRILKIQKQIKSMPGQEKMVMEYYQKNPSASQSLKGSLYEEKIISLIKSKINLTSKEINTREAEKLIAEFNKPNIDTKKFKTKSPTKNKSK